MVGTLALKDMERPFYQQLAEKKKIKEKRRRQGGRKVASCVEKVPKSYLFEGRKICLVVLCASAPLGENES